MFLVVGVLSLYRVMRLVAQELGGLSQEKIRVSVVDTWPVPEAKSSFPMDVTLAKGQDYQFQILEEGGRLVSWLRLDSNIFPDRDSIYLRIAGGAKPGKFKLKVVSGDKILRETDFQWGLLGMNFEQIPLGLGKKEIIYLTTCGKNPEVSVKTKKVELLKVDNCYYAFDFLPEQVGAVVFTAKVEGAEKEFTVNVEEKPKEVFGRTLEKGVMTLEYQGLVKNGLIRELKPEGVEFTETQEAENKRLDGKAYFIWNGEKGSYRVKTSLTEYMIPMGPASFWENSERKYFEQTTLDSKKIWEESGEWLVPGSILEETTVEEGRNGSSHRADLGNVAFDLKKKGQGWEVAYYNLNSQSEGSYDYEPETSLEDAPLLFGHYKVLMVNGEMLVYEVTVRKEEDVNKTEFRQVYP